MAKGTRREQAARGGRGEVEEKRGVKNGGNADLWSDVFFSPAVGMSARRALTSYK